MRLDERRGSPFRVGSSKGFGCVFPGVSKRKPGLKLATFSVILALQKICQNSSKRVDTPRKLY
jgi:hypothetical protein